MPPVYKLKDYDGVIIDGCFYEELQNIKVDRDKSWFTIPLTQTAIEKSTYVKVLPISAISDTAPLEFFIAGNGEDYIDLNNMPLYT